MWILIISLIALAAVAAAAGTVRNRRLQKKIDNGELDAMPEVQEVDMECCGQHEVCEKESLLAAVSKKIEYYDDEELDNTSEPLPMDIPPNRKRSFVTCSTPCNRKMWRDGCAACNCGALRCRTT